MQVPRLCLVQKKLVQENHRLFVRWACLLECLEENDCPTDPDRAREAQVEEMLEELGVYIKVAVDIESRILAGGGYLHADCEAELQPDGSRQEAIWEPTGTPYPGHCLRIVDYPSAPKSSDGNFRCPDSKNK